MDTGDWDRDESSSGSARDLTCEAVWARGCDAKRAIVLGAASAYTSLGSDSSPSALARGCEAVSDGGRGGLADQHPVIAPVWALSVAMSP